MMVFTIFTLAGIALFINKHRGWGSFCFFVALVSLLAMI
jgi:hypothetical protein